MTSVQDEVAESKKADGDFLTCRHWEAFFFVAACTGVNCDEGMFLLSASDVTLKYQSLWSSNLLFKAQHSDNLHYLMRRLFKSQWMPITFGEGSLSSHPTINSRDIKCNY
jgi:hypothetical protein